MKPRYQLIIFDWDGTLMDSVATIAHCFEMAIRDLGLPVPDKARRRDVIGLGLSEAIARLLPECDAPTRARAVARYREHFMSLDPGASALFPGVRGGLAWLERHGWRLAVATGKARRGLDLVLRATGLGPLFCASRCADESEPKPHPRMLRDILDVTGVAPSAALMVGDTVYDMEMARTAGIDRLAVSYGVHPTERLREYDPVTCADSFADVCRWLEDQHPASVTAARG